MESSSLRSLLEMNGTHSRMELFFNVNSIHYTVTCLIGLFQMQYNVSTCTGLLRCSTVVEGGTECGIRSFCCVTANYTATVQRGKMKEAFANKITY